MHDPRVGRFFAVDPLTPKYPWYTPYQFSGNRVIDMVELEGLEPAPTADRENPPSGMATDYNTGEIVPSGTLSEVLVTNRTGAKIMNAVKNIAVSVLKPVGIVSNKLLGDMTGASSFSKELTESYNADYAPSTSSTPALVVLGVVSLGTATEAGALYEGGAYLWSQGGRFLASYGPKYGFTPGGGIADIINQSLVQGKSFEEFNFASTITNTFLGGGGLIRSSFWGATGGGYLNLSLKTVDNATVFQFSTERSISLVSGFAGNVLAGGLTNYNSMMGVSANMFGNSVMKKVFGNAVFHSTDTVNEMFGNYVGNGIESNLTIDKK